MINFSHFISLEEASNFFSNSILPILILVILICGAIKKVPVYEAFIEGAKDGFKVSITIIPYLVALIVAISMFRASGAMDLIAELIKPILNKLEENMEIYHPNLTKYLSTCKSPIGMQGAMIKTYFAEMMDIPKENIVAVAITPCTAKKSEILLPNSNDTDFVITTSELAHMIREKEIDFNNLKDKEYDSIMGRGSGAGVIFGNSGGVMEAAIRTAYHFLTNESPKKELLNFTNVRGYDNVKEAEVIIGDKELKLLVVHGMTNVEPLLKDLENGKLN